MAEFCYSLEKNKTSVNVPIQNRKGCEPGLKPIHMLRRILVELICCLETTGLTSIIFVVNFV